VPKSNKILTAVLNSITDDVPVRRVLSGIRWTAVLSTHCGLASSMAWEMCKSQDEPVSRLLNPGALGNETLPDQRTGKIKVRKKLYTTDFLVKGHDLIFTVFFFTLFWDLFQPRCSRKKRQSPAGGLLFTKFILYNFFNECCVPEKVTSPESARFQE